MKELRLWNDAYRDHHQFLTFFDKCHMVLFERNKISDEHKYLGGTAIFYSWSAWEKVKEPYSLEKAWFVKDITFEDAILGDYKVKNKGENA